MTNYLLSKLRNVIDGRLGRGAWHYDTAGIQIIDCEGGGANGSFLTSPTKTVCRQQRILT